MGEEKINQEVTTRSIEITLKGLEMLESSTAGIIIEYDPKEDERGYGRFRITSLSGRIILREGYSYPEVIGGIKAMARSIVEEYINLLVRGE